MMRETEAQTDSENQDELSRSPEHVDERSLDEFNTSINDLLSDLNDLDINSIFQQQSTDDAEQRSHDIADHLDDITHRLTNTINGFEAHGHPALESLARHKQIALQTAYAVVRRKLDSITDGDDLLPPRTAEQLRDEIDGWRNALITVEDDLDTTVTVTTANIQRHDNNFADADKPIPDDVRAIIDELDEQRDTLLEQAASEEHTPVTIPTLRRVMDYGDTLITHQDLLQDTADQIITDDQINVDAVQDIEKQLRLTAKYLAGNQSVQATTTEAQDTVDDLLSVIAAAKGHNTERMDQQLKELSHGLGDITAQLVDVNNAQHPAT